MYAVTAVIRLFEPLFKAVERVHTSFKFGDNMYLKLAANDIRGRLNTRFQLCQGFTHSVDQGYPCLLKDYVI